MTTAGLALMTLAVLICLPSAVQRIQRRRARRRLRAALLGELRAELARVTAEAMRWEGLYRDKVSELTVLIEAADPETVRAAVRSLANNPLFYCAAAWTAADDWRLSEWSAADEGGAS